MQAILLNQRPNDASVFGTQNPNGRGNAIAARISLTLVAAGVALAIFDKQNYAVYALGGAALVPAVRWFYVQPPETRHKISQTLQTIFISYLIFWR